MPEFTLPVPTLIPPGETANLEFRLTLTDIQTTLDGAVATEAFGRLVPEPNGLLFTTMPWLCAYWTARRRARNAAAVEPAPSRHKPFCGPLRLRELCAGGLKVLSRRVRGGAELGGT